MGVNKGLEWNGGPQREPRGEGMVTAVGVGVDGPTPSAEGGPSPRPGPTSSIFDEGDRSEGTHVALTPLDQPGDRDRATAVGRVRLRRT